MDGKQKKTNDDGREGGEEEEEEEEADQTSMLEGNCSCLSSVGDPENELLASSIGLGSSSLVSKV